MQDYYFVVSVSITHPTMDPADITRAIGIKPDHSRRVGDKRTTPKGRVLEGINRETFWRSTPHDDKRIWSGDILLEDYLESLNRKLTRHKDYIAELVTSGGHIEYFVGWFGKSNVMATLSPRLMAETANLGIAIGLDIYLDDQIEEDNEVPGEDDENIR